MRVMLDTNILISAFLFKSRTMNLLIEKLSKEYRMVICSYTIEELKELITYKFKVDMKELDNFLRDFPFELVYSPMHVDNKLFKIRDEDDYIILHTAIIENVDIFITGDKDFDDVDVERPEIMSAQEFLKRY